MRTNIYKIFIYTIQQVKIIFGLPLYWLNFRSSKIERNLEHLQKYEPHNCPRCGQAFACQPNAITNCVCFSFTLPESVSRYLRATYAGCLCPDCLRKLIDLAKNETDFNLVKPITH
jgi:ribosomal protein L34E